MSKLVLVLILAATAHTAEISSSYSLLDKHSSFNPDLKTEPVDSHNILKKESKHDEIHPVFRGEGRARVAPVKSDNPVVHHDMLADQPMGQSQQSEVNRIDNLAIPNYAYVQTPSEVTYPDIPYAPGYGYDAAYAASNNYDVYGNSLSNYMLEPDTSAFSLLWSQVPDARAIVGFMGRTIAWVFSSFFVILLGSFLTVGFCSYSDLCTINFHGVGPIHEEMRSLMSLTPEKLEKISSAADFVKTAIDKYQKIQKVTGNDDARHRRSIFS